VMGLLSRGLGGGGCCCVGWVGGGIERGEGGLGEKSGGESVRRMLGGGRWGGYMRVGNRGEAKVWS